MAYKDTLTLYEELVVTGVPEEQAKMIAHQHGRLGDSVTNTCNEIKDQLVKIDISIIEIKTEMKWMRNIGAGMIMIFLANFIKLWIKF
jgi:hypothetical protein